MAKQTINLGVVPTGAGGDTNRAAFVKAQANFDELYATGGATSGSNASGNWTKFADGTMITWGRQVVNQTVQPGTAVAWDSAAQPAPFVGVPQHSITITFMTAANGGGEEIYGLAFPYNQLDRPKVPFLNTGHKPAAVHPSFTLGTTVAASYFVDYQSVGRWK